MNASQVKQFLTQDNIYDLLKDLGGEPTWKDVIVSRTCCHNGPNSGKHKLVYYHDSKTFQCYTNCGTLDIFSLVQKVLNMDFYNSYSYICAKFGITRDFKEGFETDKLDFSFFENFEKQEEFKTLPSLKEKILFSYDDIYHIDWINDGISIESMRKFGIKFNIYNNQIVIPHYDENNKLVGVRVRNLNKDLVESGIKYSPIYWKNQVLKHPTGSILYGLNKNIENINKIKKIILFESEKSVLQLDTMNPELSIGVCLSGSNLTNHQIEILKTLDIEEVIIALDKEYDEIGSEQEKYYAKKIKETIIDKLSPYFIVSVIWDIEGLIDEKSSPTDHGKEIFNKLFKNRIFI